MAFSYFEESRYLGAPDTLYLFSYRTQKFSYADGDSTIVVNHGLPLGTIAYTPIPINRSAISASGTLDKANMTLELPLDTDVTELFRVYPPSDIVYLTIYQGHSDDPDYEFLSVWSGRVLSCQRDQDRSKLTCEPISTSLRRPGLRRRYQYGCPHALYGDQCRASKASYTVSSTAGTVNRATLTLPSGWNGSFAKARFVDGVIEWGSGSTAEIRTIRQVNEGTNTLTVGGILSTLTAGTAVTLSLGCNHVMDGCRYLNNIQNFGGQPWIPRKNPHGNANNFY
jgi:uncharacterized phage protein (TIGR02218 family)